MSLDFTSGSDNVNGGSDTTVDNNFTGSLILWAVHDNDATTDEMLWCKNNTTNGLYMGDFASIKFLWFALGGNIEMIADTLNFTHYGTGKWVCIAAVWDDGAGASSQLLYVGDESNDLAVPSSYVSKADAGGAPSSNAANDMLVGGDGSAAEWDGRIAIMAHWDVALTAAELREQQYYGYPKTRISDMQVFWQLGVEGTGTIPDMTENGNDGTVNGTSFSNTKPDIRYSLNPVSHPLGIGHGMRKRASGIIA